jgi:hypothetical protein
MPRTPNFAFVLGTGRCGSTLVHEILARHTAVGFLSNMDDLSPIPLIPGTMSAYLYRRLPPSTQEKGRFRFAPSEGYRVLDRDVSPILSTPCRDLLASDASPWMISRTRGFFEKRAFRVARPLYIHKFTGWPRSRFLDAALPDSRFVHVIRDGRAVANSWLQMDWWLGYGGPERWHFGPLPEPYEAEWRASNRSFVTLAGIAWKILTEAFEDARSAAKPGMWLDVRYEDVVADPVPQFRAILSFLGLEWNVAFESQLDRYTFHSGAKARYRSDLLPEQLDRLDASLAAHLERWGYTV